MPELPEVETTCRGITPSIQAQTIKQIIVRESRLRWPVPDILIDKLAGERINAISRRGKYLLFQTQVGTMILHLGMSGSLRILHEHKPPQKHDHVDFIFNNGACLRYTDPRRFGTILWTEDDPLSHHLLSQLGPEPLTKNFNGKYLFEQSHRRTAPIKIFLMNSHIVVGVGNIYAAESLFMAGIHPLRQANRISLNRYQTLTHAIKQILKKAIAAGGTTLKDFYASDGKPGYFKQKLLVYGRENEPCMHCQKPLEKIQLNQRATVYCAHCQK